MFPSPMTFRFIEDYSITYIHENGEIGSSKLDKITSLIFTEGVDCPNNFSLKISGPWVGAFDIAGPDDFLLHIGRCT